MPNISSNGRRENGFRPNKNKTLTLKESKPKRWTHQDDLMAAIGKHIKLTTLAGANIDGELLAADQFSIKVLPTGMPDLSFAVVVYKSALTSFEVRQ